MDKILVTIIGIFGIGFTYWYFLGKRETKVAVSDSVDSDHSADSKSSLQASSGQALREDSGQAGSPQVDIVVEGGYTPSVISVQKGRTTRLNFIRRDPSSCLEEVVLPDFKIRKTLPLNQKVTVEITPGKSGQYSISCGMNMFHGKIIVYPEPVEGVENPERSRRVE